MNRALLSLFLFGAFLCAPLSASAVTIATVVVGDAGNPRDPQSVDGHRGEVGYEFRIGKYEVTNAQYVEFLNAKAASDPFALFNPNMADNIRGGIIRNGSTGSYVYTVKPDMSDKPVNFVSWYDAIRFANWLNNGQGVGDTETGAYTMGTLGAGGIPTNGANIERNNDASWFVPSENEWHKSAYYQPAAKGGDADNYWGYATGNEGPLGATAASNGDISNPGPGIVNYLSNADWNSQDGNVTTVGSAGPLSASYYGTFDQAGNVQEWTEATYQDRRYRGIRGGSWASTNPYRVSANSIFNFYAPTGEDATAGFRVAAVIPEPSTGVMAAIGCCLLGLLRKRFRKP